MWGLLQRVCFLDVDSRPHHLPETYPHMHKIAQFIFWSTLLLFAAVLASAPYVGVYLTYVAIPVIVISGLIVRWTKPKPPKEPSAIARFFSEAKAVLATEAADAKEMLNNEAKEIEKWRLERAAERKTAAINKIGEI